MALREQREEASRRRRREAGASQARLLSARLSETHSPRDLERMDTPSPLPSSPVGRLNRIEAMEAAQRMPSSPAGVGVPARNVSQSPVPTIRGPVSARPTQGGKQPRRRPPPPPGGG